MTESFVILPLLKEASDLAKLVKTESFADLTITYLLNLQASLVNKISCMKFYMKPAERKENVINNPLKIIEFIKLSQDSSKKKFWQIKSDFMKMEGRVVDSVWTNIDHAPGYKPKFTFAVKGRSSPVIIDTNIPSVDLSGELKLLERTKALDIQISSDQAPKLSSNFGNFQPVTQYQPIQEKPKEELLSPGVELIS